jgi:4-hydroxy-4-methyl-2-oxoglutarate aldolase
MTPQTFPLRHVDLDYDVDDVRRRYLRLSSGQVCDSLSERGLKGQAMAAGIYPLIHTMKVAGPAFTVQAMTTPNMDSVNVRLGMVTSLFKGCVQVRNSGGNLSVGHFGEVNATAARAAGCTGAVLDGSTRDSNMLIELGFPTFCRFRSPVESFGRFMVTDYMVPIQVAGVDGLLRIDPGDFLIGDNDGVVVVPRPMTVSILEAAEQRARKETDGRAQVADGAHPLDVQERIGRF